MPPSTPRSRSPPHRPIPAPQRPPTSASASAPSSSRSSSASAAWASSSAPSRSPSIARVYSAGTHADLAWIAFERIPGRPLRDLLRDGPLPSRAAFRILADLADALAHAHSFGLIHRDVKPENAMVRPDGRAVLLDFGVAIPNEGDATPTHRVGTPAYQPPWPVPAGAPTFIDVFEATSA